MEAFSYAYELETCMYAGGDKLENGEIKGWSDYSPEQWLNESVFSIKQDVKLLDEFILAKGAQSMKDAMDKNNIKSEDITYFIPHVSSNFFVEGLKKGLNEKGIGMSDDKWFMNLSRIGNVGSASIYLALEELMGSGNLKKGDKILLSVPESGRFSFAYAYLTVC
jgi:3-oxoacyl-[acyl-carrier-protein] synthase-3